MQRTTPYSHRLHNLLWALYLLNLLLLPVFAATIAMILLAKYGFNRTGEHLLLAFILCFTLLVILPSITWFILPHGALFWALFIT